MRLGAGDESDAEGSRVALPDTASPRLSSKGPGGGGRGLEQIPPVARNCRAAFGVVDLRQMG